MPGRATLTAVPRDASKVIDIATRRPHLAGEAICTICRAQWVAVAPVGTVWLDCPQCGASRGVMRFPVEDDAEHHHCACGGHLFAVTAARAYCPSCGRTLSLDLSQP